MVNNVSSPASVNRYLQIGLGLCGKDLTRVKIESRSQSAAAVICKVDEVPFESSPGDILGVVALLGTVQSIELSRLLFVLSMWLDLPEVKCNRVSFMV